MQDEKRETICYIIEREFLTEITIAELMNRIIQSHMKNDEMQQKETVKREMAER